MIEDYDPGKIGRNIHALVDICLLIDDDVEEKTKQKIIDFWENVNNL